MSSCDRCNGNLPEAHLCSDCIEDDLKRKQSDIKANTSLKPRAYRSTVAEDAEKRAKASSRYQWLSDTHLPDQELFRD